MTQTQATPESPVDASQIVIKASALTKVFRDFWMRNRVTAVDRIELDVRRGEVFGLLGPNGSGKSTTIKMILGLLHPTAGRIAVFGKVPRDVSIKNEIGYLPEESYLYRFLNARETLDYYGKLFHQDRRKRQRRIDQLLEYVGLDKVQRRPVGEYSKGMQRRIGLAQALINDPQLLILDEPTTGMDPIGTRQIKDLILDLRQRGKTILLCSHLLADVEDVTDRVAIMFGGKVRQSGPIADLLTQRDVTTIATTSLDDDTVTEIEQVLERRGKAIDRVDHPRQRLEELFLDIVHQAQSEGAVTSGAGSGGRLAAFLAGEERSAHMPEDTDPHKLLDELTTDKTEAVTPAPTATPTPMEHKQDAVLDELVTKDESAAKPQAADTATPSPKPTVEADRDLLDSLTGNDKKDG